ncbi:MAG: peroxiredoxin [Betaproteobacteria bacterium RIFCSPLOWO2_02_FULL_67_26]|nr:MAG: peroxiredoxin [Betaproteobacteria bacterium RIFCSPLOWO2_02_FULL_67_26]
MNWLIFAAAALGGLLLWRVAIAAIAPKPGDPAPEFALPDQSSTTRSLAAFRDKWLVLYFYPRDDTPGCTVQACSFRDAWQKLTALGAEVVGVSVDDVARHFAFAKRFELPFPLLADTGGAVASRYGSALNLGLFKIARRNTFLIDPQGRIARVYLSASTSRNSQQVIEDLQALRKSEVPE